MPPQWQGTRNLDQQRHLSTVESRAFQKNRHDLGSTAQIGLLPPQALLKLFYPFYPDNIDIYLYPCKTKA
jgi:hypothetical protein